MTSGGCQVGEFGKHPVSSIDLYAFLTSHALTAYASSGCAGNLFLYKLSLYYFSVAQADALAVYSK